MKIRFSLVNLLFFSVLIFLLVACNSNPNGTNTTSENNNSGEAGNQTHSIKRYEQALFSIPPADLKQGLEKIAPDFRVFLGNQYTSPEALQQLHDFITDQQNLATFRDCEKQYTDLKRLEADFQTAFDNLAKALPSFKQPVVYTYVSGFDFEYPVKYADTALIIGLDMYLGSNYKKYREMGVPVYITRRLTAEHILPDSFREIANSILQSKKNQLIIDAMIEEGKVLYFLDVALPDTDDATKIGYTPGQIQWCKENEQNLWSFIIENELLYKADARAFSILMTDGPFTSSFSQDSPARTGAWLGWQIVRSYMKRNKVALSNLLANTNPQEILELSGYKPERK